MTIGSIIFNKTLTVHKQEIEMDILMVGGMAHGRSTDRNTPFVKMTATSLSGKSISDIYRLMTVQKYIDDELVQRHVYVWDVYDDEIADMLISNLGDKIWK